jgi:hypothetical protein
MKAMKVERVSETRDGKVKVGDCVRHDGTSAVVLVTGILHRTTYRATGGVDATDERLETAPSFRGQPSVLRCHFETIHDEEEFNATS